MNWASVASTLHHTRSALDESSDQLQVALGAPPDLVVAFVSPHHGPAFEPLVGGLSDRFPGAVVLGCTAGGVVGGGQEIERRAGLSLTGATLPDVTLTPLRLLEDDLPPADAPLDAWEQALGVQAATDPHFLLLPDPFTFDPGNLLLALDHHFPYSAKAGGLVSGAREPGTVGLFLQGEVHRHGFVGLALAGDIAMDTVVAQGCRPVGAPMFVTRCSRNCIEELDGRPPIEALRELYDTLSPRDRHLFENALFIGIQMRDQVHYRPGDFLIRNVVGLHRDSGALVVGALPSRFQVVQLHVRDSRSSAEDLDALLTRYRQVHGGQTSGGLLFSCVGRGEGLYGRPNHDSDLIARHLGAVPLGGFFGSGEIGAVHGRTYVHGYTSALALFRAPERQ